MAKARKKREPAPPPVQGGDWRWILLTTAIVGTGVAVIFALGSCRANNPEEARGPMPRAVALEPEAMPMPPLPPMEVEAKEISWPLPPLPQPPQPVIVPPPLDLEHEATIEPEDNTTERPGCEGGACDTGWYLGKRLRGRR